MLESAQCGSVGEGLPLRCLYSTLLGLLGCVLPWRLRLIKFRPVPAMPWLRHTKLQVGVMLEAEARSCPILPNLPTSKARTVLQQSAKCCYPDHDSMCQLRGHGIPWHEVGFSPTNSKLRHCPHPDVFAPQPEALSPHRSNHGIPTLLHGLLISLRPTLWVGFGKPRATQLRQKFP